jgi:hypothetical protein
VRREDVAAGGGLARFAIAEFVLAHGRADALQREERRVALVHVADGRLDADGVQGAQAADAEQDLLSNPHLAVAAVEARSDAAQLGRVFGQVGVEQVEFDAAHIDEPDLDSEGVRAEVDADLAGLALFVLDERGGPLVDVVHGIAFELPAIFGELLGEVALPIRQADADQRNAEIRSGLQVVAGQHAQAAGVDRHALVQAELGGEIGDRGVVCAVLVVNQVRLFM